METNTDTLVSVASLTKQEIWITPEDKFYTHCPCGFGSDSFNTQLEAKRAASEHWITCDPYFAGEHNSI